MSDIGHLTVQGHLEHRRVGVFYRVLLDGVDVTARCKEAHDREGWVLLFKHRDGRPYVGDDGEVAMERLAGVVEIVPGDPF